MKINANTIEEYFQKADDKESALRELDSLIRQHAPDLKPEFVGGTTITMVGYGMVPYKPKSAKEETRWPLVALAAQKNYISVYVCAVIDNEYIAEKYAATLGKVSVGKSCIRFKKIEDLNTSTLAMILKDINQRFKRGEKLYGA